VTPSLEAACDDKRARKASNDSVTLTPKIDLLRWKNYRDGALPLAGVSALGFDVENQRKVTVFCGRPAVEAKDIGTVYG